MTSPQHPDVTGPNAWLVDEMYEQYLSNPASVTESWREFFADYSNNVPYATTAVANAPAVVAAPSVPSAPVAPLAAAAASPAGAADSALAVPVVASPVVSAPVADRGEPIRGAAASIVTNMQASLTVPTATSFRNVPAKLLEVNRKIINGYLTRTRGGKVSFTHLIAYAAVRAIADTTPVMNSMFIEGSDGKPRVQRNEHINVGLAVDVQKPDGSRTLVVPNIKGVDTLDFKSFFAAYEDLIRKVRTNKLTLEDYQGTTVSITNPGTIGTVQSVPRLMPGQGVIVGVGSIEFPAEFQGADQHALAELGVSKVVTITSTYDHRVIQGAESGMFLKAMHELLLGERGFYEGIFASLGLPYEAVRWKVDVNPLDKMESRLEKQMQVNTLVTTYRTRGHLIADLDPLRWKEPETFLELDPATYGLTLWDLDREFLTGGVAGTKAMPFGDLLGVLRDAYCRTIGVEYMHIQEPAEKRWIQQQVEGTRFDLSKEEYAHILQRLNAAEAFEKFLATKYVGTKRFGIEGAESAIPLLDEVLSAAAESNFDGVVLGMAHRGRLNVLANIVGKSHDQIFREFEGYVDPESIQGSGDVKYHLGAVGKFVSRSGAEITVELAANPSHLETVNPVVAGIVRARQDQINMPGSYSVLPLLIHGDAAFAGQGLVAECLNYSGLSGYRVGGTIHLVINNQLGFTTSPEQARSSQYCTDVAKMIDAPVFHVNGDDPEACVRVARLAFAYRESFHKDVVIDMVCYRRYGHNEGDDPSYTQPLMYKRIEARRSVRKIYMESLVKRGLITVEEAEKALDDFQGRLQTSLDQTRQGAPPAGTRARKAPEPIGVLPHVTTGVDRAVLDRVFAGLTTVPAGFTIHPKLVRQFETRTAAYNSGDLDWATGEALAFGSLLLEGTDIRFAGEDSRRGTFSQRHAMLIDYENGSEHLPLAHLASAAAGERQGNLWLYDSLLSEYAALGFEYGYSVANKDALTLWEAQFGDFVNGAQIIIDQYLVAAEDKWQQTSGLVMLLPHGFEGQGPEHSSARIERFLSACAEDNIQVANVTTAAQYFHILRRQMHREIRKPLVIFTPKSLLRAKQARSPIGVLTSGSFAEVLADPAPLDAGAVERVVLCSGKVAYDAMAYASPARQKAAIVRVEQLFPWPYAAVASELAKYPNARDIVWLQEEPENMGPWNFAKGRLYEAHEDTHSIRRVSRGESGSPATGSHAVHLQELEDLMNDTFSDL